MADIKSAAEIAREKLATIGETTEEERLRWQYIPHGEKLAASYLDKKLDFTAEMAKYKAGVRQYVMAGAEKVLVANISLPKSESVRSKNEKVMDILLEVKNDKQRTKEVIEKIRHIFNHFNEQGMQQQQQAGAECKQQKRCCWPDLSFECDQSCASIDLRRYNLLDTRFDLESP